MDGTPDDSGLRFDESVPVEEIALSAPELEGPDAVDYEVIGQNTTYRLAQRPVSHVVFQLGQFDGTLITDGYGAYEKFSKRNASLTHSQCWVHCRRQFEQAKEAEPEAVAIALAYIGRLYEHEAYLREQALSGQEKLAYRTQHSLPVVEAFFGWCYEQRQRIDLVRSNPLSKALAYAMKRQQELQVFLSDPEVPMDTNHLERALRVIPMGRKNWNFCWTGIGAEHVGIIQSLLVTCRLHSVNPYEYLVDVLQRISTHPASRVENDESRMQTERQGEIGHPGQDNQG